MQRPTAWYVYFGWAATLGACVIAGAHGSAQGTLSAQTVARCRVEGQVTSRGNPLPGVSVVVHVGDALKAATSTGVDGKYAIVFAPNATYHLSLDLTAFTHVERDVALGPPPCDAVINVQLALAPRGEGPRADAAPRPGTAAGAASNEAGATGRGSVGRGGRGGQGAQGAQRFETLNVTNANGAAMLEEPLTPDDADAARLLPAGFSLDALHAVAVVMGDSGDATRLDRGALNDRLQSIGFGQFDPANAQFAAGVGPGVGTVGAPNPGDAQGPAVGGRGGPPGGRGFGPGSGGGFIIGGRGARGQSPYQGTVTYTFGGSLLNAAPFQLRPDVPTAQPQFAQNLAGVTIGGPVKIPGVYKDTNRRTNFQLNYTGNRSNNLFDQYATVPTEAMRNGNFSSSFIQLIDPKTGQPFTGNQIPASRMDPTALALLDFIPAPNLPGASQNYHVSTTAHSSADSLSLRFTQNLSPTVVQGGGRGGFGGRGFGGGGRGGGPGGGRGGPGSGTNIILSAQVQYRRNETNSLNVFPGLGSRNTNTSIAAPLSLNVVRGRTINNFTVSLTRTTAQSTNAFSGVNNVADQAGVLYPIGAATDPLNWGVPNLSFSGFTGLRDASASLRSDNRIATSYFWLHPIGRHRIRVGADYRFDTTSTESNANARGSFTFTGLYSTGGGLAANRSGADFADFLLGAPQQAALQVGGVTYLHGKSLDAYVEDNWQRSARLTFNLGLRYELVWPYTEAHGHMVNLDAASGFTAVAPVVAGGTGPYTGAFPAGLLYADKNNLGPRIGVAYRVKAGTVLRGGYSITYNPGSYATIARQLVAQPPFAATETVVGTALAPLTFQDALLSSASTTNSYGVDKNYALGRIQTWNATLSRNLNPVWSVMVGYTGVKGTDIDLLSAPNRGPSGVLIPTVQPFIWESSGGHSILNLASFQLLRRLAHGVSGSASYTLSKSMDNTPSLGSVNTIVAQDPRNPAAEWALSNFDRRHQFTGNLLLELPFGANRRWLNSTGFFSSIIGDWSISLVVAAQSGTPLTARVVGAATSVAQGASGSLRADYTGAPVQVGHPTVTEFFNPAAFAVPANGLFGDSARNMIIGPAGHQLNAVFLRDVPLGGSRTITLQLNATNLLNTAQWSAIDTNINSPTFGQVLAIKPSRTVNLTARFRF